MLCCCFDYEEKSDCESNENIKTPKKIFDLKKKSLMKIAMRNEINELFEQIEEQPIITKEYERIMKSNDTIILLEGCNFLKRYLLSSIDGETNMSNTIINDTKQINHIKKIKFKAAKHKVLGFDVKQKKKKDFAKQKINNAQCEEENSAFFDIEQNYESKEINETLNNSENKDIININSLNLNEIDKYISYIDKYKFRELYDLLIDLNEIGEYDFTTHQHANITQRLFDKIEKTLVKFLMVSIMYITSTENDDEYDDGYDYDMFSVYKKREIQEEIYYIIDLELASTKLTQEIYFTNEKIEKIMRQSVHYALIELYFYTNEEETKSKNYVLFKDITEIFEDEKNKLRVCDTFELIISSFENVYELMIEITKNAKYIVDEFDNIVCSHFTEILKQPKLMTDVMTKCNYLLNEYINNKCIKKNVMSLKGSSLIETSWDAIRLKYKFLSEIISSLNEYMIQLVTNTIYIFVKEKKNEYKKLEKTHIPMDIFNIITQNIPMLLKEIYENKDEGLLNKVAQLVSNTFCSYNMFMDKVNTELYTTPKNTILIDDLAYTIIPHINDNLFIIEKFPEFKEYFKEKISENSSTMIQLVFDLMITNCSDTIENNISKFCDTYLLYHDTDFMELFVNGKWYDKKQENRPLFKILEKTNIFLDIFAKLNSTIKISLNNEDICVKQFMYNKIYNIIKIKYIDNFILNIKYLNKDRSKKRLNEDLDLFREFSINKEITFEKQLGSIETCIEIFTNNITIDKILSMSSQNNFDRDMCKKIISLKKDITPTLQKQILDAVLFVPTTLAETFKQNHI